ncbi:Crp/Fnr family transcriptional regulator [Actinosynnema pretiosum subsp. pretiosum]|uniref:Transcriptional regulator, Crp/Fnr family n=2 Tax=Actinosynnema TaxID=40566 RepID=C6WB38_ACTMD|nr:Crp/Fnr family transcriptional regulator [Actinosynnema mirum]ACU39329.1 transcriptional regulator, Crp/Fnr family [Actinosynnema mirum DSM 43827]QUF03210.1 Crp/Fnr family transcriptional regulator [Actinosynnema pretiosum subsp. pretiosum]
MSMLPPRAQAELLELGTERAFKRGDVLMRQGDTTDHVVLLHQALVKATGVQANGRETLFSIKVGGDLVGEMAAMDNSHRSATVTLCGDGTGRVISAVAFRGYLRANPDAHFALTRMIMQTLKWADRRRLDFTGPTLVRLARLLGELADAHRSGQGDQAVLNLGLSQGDLADLIGAEEDTTRKELRVLRDRGLISLGYRSVTVADRAGLDRLADGRDAGGHGRAGERP